MDEPPQPPGSPPGAPYPYPPQPIAATPSASQTLTGFAPPPSGPIAAPPPLAPAAPPAPLPEARDASAGLPAPTKTATDETLSRKFLWISLVRAFRLEIQTREVLASERAELESHARHVRDPDQQAFLAWRRSVLLMIAIMFVPLAIFRFFEAFDGPPLPPVARAFQLLPAVAESAFCLIAFDQLKNWAQWKRQRRVLAWAWAAYFVAPFIVYIYPYRGAFDDTPWGTLASATHLGGVQLNSQAATAHIVVGIVFGVQAMLALGPKVISLMPGLIRSSIVTKLLFPGMTAPGWLMMLAAPIYALFAYIIVLLPYQATGSWHFVVGNGGLLAAQVYIGIAGRRLTVPLSEAESKHRIHKAWLIYIGMLVVSVGFMFYGLFDFIRELHFGWVRVVTSVLAIASNVLLDTLVGTDMIVSAMAMFRRRGELSAEHTRMLHDAEVKLDVFCG